MQIKFVWQYASTNTLFASCAHTLNQARSQDFVMGVLFRRPWGVSPSCLRPMGVWEQCLQPPKARSSGGEPSALGDFYNFSTKITYGL